MFIVIFETTIRTDVIEKSVDLRVIDFDWAGEAGQVYYPAERNREIWWPGEAGGPTEQDHGGFLETTVEKLYLSIEIYIYQT